MKKIFAVLLSSAALCQAALIPIGISPADTDSAIGLSPSNEVPAVLNSAGSGGPISGGLVYDTDTYTLMLTVGYGSAAGFTDLTGPATSLTLNGPAATNQNAAVLFDLAALGFPAVNPAQGGVIFGNVVVPTDEVADLLAGFDYINIGTTNEPSGEIRGQLIPTIPIIVCPNPTTNECSTPAVVSVQISDPAGYAMTAVWSLNGTPLQTNQVPASLPAITTNIVFTAGLPLGTNLIEIAVTDSASNTVSCSTTVTVVDTIAPVIESVSASFNTNCPAVDEMVMVTVSATVTDNCGPTCWKIIGVQSNESGNKSGNCYTSHDWEICWGHTVFLRAGYVYTITIQAKDAAGNLSDPSTVTVTVPKCLEKGQGKCPEKGQKKGK
ncbi:MAG: CHRD domain-containing protein [Verrucomicrobiota bacterium]|jgi:hypothetical protein